MPVWVEIVRCLGDPYWVRDTPEAWVSFQYVFVKMNAKLQVLTFNHMKPWC